MLLSIINRQSSFWTTKGTTGLYTEQRPKIWARFHISQEFNTTTTHNAVFFHLFVSVSFVHLQQHPFTNPSFPMVLFLITREDKEEFLWCCGGCDALKVVGLYCYVTIEWSFRIKFSSRPWFDEIKQFYTILKHRFSHLNTSYMYSTCHNFIDCLSSYLYANVNSIEW